MVARVGTEATRRALGHSPDTFTLERYYMQMGSLFESTQIALGEDSSTTGYNAQLIDTWSPLALGRLDDEQASQIRGLALRAMTDKLIASDPNPLSSDFTPEQLKQYRKRQRAIAQQALIEEQTEVAQESLTHDAFNARQAAVKSSEFADAVMKRAFRLAHTNEDPSLEVDDEDDSLFMQQDAEPDLDEQVRDETGIV